MTSYHEKQVQVRDDLDRAIRERAADGYPWVGKYGWNSSLPALEGLKPGQVVDFCFGYAISIARLAAIRIESEVRRLIPEAILITTDEPCTEYDDEAGCDVSISASLHVKRDDEWVLLEDQWEAQFPGLASDIQDFVNKWPELSGAACVDEDAELIWEPIDDKGEARAPSIILTVDADSVGEGE